MATLEEKRKTLERKFVESRPPLAYAKLSGRAGDDSPFDMLITTLPVELGRGPISTTPGARLSLGEQKALSRQHARLQWNQEKSCFELVCLGKNGVFAAGKFIAKDGTVELTSKMPLKIGPARLYFLAAIRSTCSTMSGFKMMQKAFEKAAARGKTSATTGLSVDDLVAQIMEMFPKSEHELGGLDNLKRFISDYIVEDLQTFEPIAGTSPLQYRMKTPSASTTTTTATTTATTTTTTSATSRKADDEQDAASRKKQKTD